MARMCIRSIDFHPKLTPLVLSTSLRLRPILKEWNADLVASKAISQLQHNDQDQEDAGDEDAENEQLRPEMKP